MSLFSVLFLIGAGEAAKDAKKELEKLQGEWEVVSMDFLRNNFLLNMRDDETITRKTPLVIKGNVWTPPMTTCTLTVKIDPTKDPKELDLLGDIDGTEVIWRGIYKIEGETLIFCRAHIANDERPKEFKAGEGVCLFVFKRV